VTWCIVGQQEHLVRRLVRGGATIHTGCGWLIQVSKADQERHQAPRCQSCRTLAAAAVKGAMAS
jgi:hypothetical protein